MIEFFVSGQSLKFFSPVIAADSLNYLTAKVNFADAQWDGFSKWLHFRQDEELGADTYDLQLNENDEITAEQKLNLTVGQWEIYLTGTKEESRLTTVPVILTVKESGLIDSPLHELPISVAEQVDYNASLALRFAQEVRDAAERGEFNGTSLSPMGHFETVQELEALIPKPNPGDVYSVGEELPYDIYTWDSINFVWRNQGQLQGPPGEDGKNGTVFIPSVDTNGNLSWKNDGGLENPATRNIMGPAGKDGSVGPAGPGAFEKAQEAGYTGTEDTFYAALTYMPYHNRRHLPDGADPITMQTGNYADASVTADKIASEARTQYFATSLAAASWAGTAAPFTIEVNIEGLIAGDRPKVYFTAPDSVGEVEAQQEAYGLIYDVYADDGKATFYALEKPEVDITVTLEASRI